MLIGLQAMHVIVADPATLVSLGNVAADPVALVSIVGLVMLQNVVEVAWDDPACAFPAGMTVVAMPLTYSIAWGIAAGIITYPLVKTAQGRANDIHPVQWMLAFVFVLYFAVRTGGLIH